MLHNIIIFLESAKRFKSRISIVIVPSVGPQFLIGTHLDAQLRGQDGRVDVVDVRPRRGLHDRQQALQHGSLERTSHRGVRHQGSGQGQADARQLAMQQLGLQTCDSVMV